MPSVFENLAQEQTQDQLRAAAQTTADTLTAVDADSPWPSADYSPPLVPLAAGGVDVAAGAEVQLVAATAGRVKVSVNHAGADGTGNLWLGFGQTATANVGEWLEPGGRWEEFYAGAVRVRNTGSGPVRVTWMEWGA